MAGIAQVFVLYVLVALTNSLPHHHHDFQHNHKDMSESSVKEIEQKDQIESDINSILTHVEKRLKRSPKDVVNDLAGGSNSDIVFQDANQANPNRNENSPQVKQPNKSDEIAIPNNNLNSFSQGSISSTNNNSQNLRQSLYNLIQLNNGQLLLVPVDSSQTTNGQIFVPQQISQGQSQVFLSNSDQNIPQSIHPILVVDNGRNVPQNVPILVSNNERNLPQGNVQVIVRGNDLNSPQANSQVMISNGQNIPQGNPQIYGIDNGSVNGIGNNNAQNIPLGNSQIQQNIPIGQGQIVYTNIGQNQGSSQNIPQGNQVYILANDPNKPQGQVYVSNNVQNPQNKYFELLSNGQNSPLERGQILLLNNNPQNIPLSNGQVLFIGGQAIQGVNPQNLPQGNGQIVWLGNGQNTPQGQGQLYILNNGQYTPIGLANGQMRTNNGQIAGNPINYNQNIGQGLAPGVIAIGTTPNKDAETLSAYKDDVNSQISKEH